MKTRTYMTEEKTIVVEPKKVTVYIASDGEEFVDKILAESYERKLTIDKLRKKYKLIDLFDYEIEFSEEGHPYMIYVEEVNDSTVSEILQMFSFVKFSNGVLKKGYNIIIDFSDNSNCKYDALYILDVNTEIERLQEHINKLKELTDEK